MKKAFGVLSLLALATSAMALTPTLDGTINSAEYGAGYQVAAQTTNTGFGDMTNGAVDAATSGGEMNTLSITDDATHVYIAIAGNFPNDGNQANILIDADSNAATGATSVTTDNFGTLNGLVLPAGFGYDGGLAPNAGGPDLTIYANSKKAAGNGATTIASDFLGSAADSGAGVPTTGTITGTPTNAGASSAFSFGVALNNSNVLGVDGTGATAANSAAVLAVTTGLEVSIPKTYLKFINNGTPTTAIRVIVLYGAASGFASNQVLPGLVTPAGNLGNNPNLSTSAIGTPVAYTFTAGSAVSDWSMLD